MSKKLIFTLLSLILTGLFISGCGPANLSDEEFAEAARGICQTLETEINSLNQLDYAGRADAYQKAASALAEFQINEESAPQGASLRTGLSELASANSDFAAAFDAVVDELGMEISKMMVFFTEDGSIFATDSGSIFTAAKLEIDESLALEMFSWREVVEGAAKSLGLEECAPEQVKE